MLGNKNTAVYCLFMLYHCLGECSILIGCRVSIKKW